MPVHMLFATSALVAVSGYGQPQDKVAALAAGFEHYLVKPVQMEQLVTLLDQVAALQRSA